MQYKYDEKTGTVVEVPPDEEHPAPEKPEKLVTPPTIHTGQYL